MDSENSRQQPRANLHALDHGPEMLAIASNSLNEEKRLEAIRTAFEQFEADPAVKDAINNLVRHFHWCRDARNKLLHAEPYPPSLGSDPQLLYLIKRIDKRSRQSGYMKLSVDYLRSIAGKSERVSYKVQE
jgi:hypothetical protein